MLISVPKGEITRTTPMDRRPHRMSQPKLASIQRPGSSWSLPGTVNGHSRRLADLDTDSCADAGTAP
jgi:hypothetical protein